MRLEVSCKDRVGITQDVLDILVEYEIDLRGIEIDEQGKIFLNFPNIEFANFQHLMPKIRMLDGIEDVKTTPFMPTEREQYQLQALLQTLPDPVLSIDTKGKIILVNDVVINQLNLSKDNILGTDISEFLKGFNIHRWLESKTPKSQSKKVNFLGQDYLLDLLPVMVPDSDKNDILAGAVFLFKSEYRLGQQLTSFHQANLDSFSLIQANSKLMKQVIKDAKRIAELDGHILLLGETGTGKTMLANACQHASHRHDKAFLKLNCIGGNEALEAMLFGSEIGMEREGLLLQAQEGTLLIEEIGDLPLSTQTRLVNALEYGVKRLTNNSESEKLNVRLICTSQKDLTDLTVKGAFREDLLYRLNQFSLVMPPLRECKADIPVLIEFFVNKQSLQLGRKAPKISQACMDYLQSYSWPGNVKQCENVICMAVCLLEGDELLKEYIRLPTSPQSNNYICQEFAGSLDEAVKGFEKELLTRLYPSYPSSRLLAKRLHLSHTAIANKLREYGINKIVN
ncbi:sigma-54-dependent transcriptional regulator [Paraglaciecola sp. L3A3]|uniref:sigma-54-dependent transcriptional regulator n=1 Tax=Paraglaciecola sp. L3A3 TaxID=2686358 RepID=UPI00131EBE10|nr:sigma 54-interacting transcriptional regulator [Paraglaciecola sp. L3A3]